MPSRLLPLFPLQVVVFPRTPLPLHIFEERYKEMVGGAMRDNSEFGIVLAKDGGIVNAGCTVTVEKLLQMYPDGRMDVLTRGQRRFEILSLNEEKEYLQAEVNFFDDEDPPTPPRNCATRRSRITARSASCRGLTGVPIRTSRTASLASNWRTICPTWTFSTPCCATGRKTERLKQLNQYLALYIPRLRTVERMKELAPTNGHGGKPAGL